MIFTKEDYKKIERYLKANSVKDSEFQDALPIDGDEIFVVTQDGHNRKVNIKSFVSQFFNLHANDFVNVTEVYESPNITLEEAIATIPIKARKEGLVITFLNPDGKWELHQFTGKLNQWNITDLWDNIFDVSEYVINSFLPDEEDITKSLPDKNGNSYLSLKDRSYDPDNFSGLGRVILRKNIQETAEDPKKKINILSQKDFLKSNTIYEIRYDFDLNGNNITLPENSYIEYAGGSIKNGIVYDNSAYLDTVVLPKNSVYEVNTLSQSMFNKSNVIYEIRYDFDINYKNIILPNNCTLKFNGGRLLNGTITGDESKIIAPSDNMIFSNVTIEGTWHVSNIYSKWFNLSKEENFDNINNFRNMMKLAKSDLVSNVYIESGEFYTSSYTLNEDGEYKNAVGIRVYSNTHIYNAATLRVIGNPYEKHNLFHIEDAENIVIEGGKLIGDVRTHTGTTGEWGTGIYPQGVKNLVIKDIEIVEFWGDGIDIQALYSDYENSTTTGHCENILIDNVRCLNNRRQGLSIEGAIGVTVRDSEFSGTGSIKFTAPGAGIDIEPWFDTEIVADITIENCKLFNNSSEGLLLIPRKNEGSKNFVFRNIQSDQGIWIRGGKNIIVDNFKNEGNGYCCIWGVVDNLSVKNSVFNNELYFNGNVSNTVIDSCIFDMMRSNWAGYAITFQEGTNNAYNNIVISNNVFKDTNKVRWINIGTPTSKIDFIGNHIECSSNYELQLGGGDFINNDVFFKNNSRIRIKNRTGNTVNIVGNNFKYNQYVDYLLEFLDVSTIVNDSIASDYIICNNTFNHKSYWEPFTGEYKNLTVVFKYNNISRDIRPFIPELWTYEDTRRDDWYTLKYSPNSRNNISPGKCYCIKVPLKRSVVKITTTNKYTVNSVLYSTVTEFEINSDRQEVIRKPTIAVKADINIQNADMDFFPQFAYRIVDTNVEIYMKDNTDEAICFFPSIELRSQSELTGYKIDVTSVTTPGGLDFSVMIDGNLRSDSTTLFDYIQPYRGMEMLINNINKVVYDSSAWRNADGTLCSKVKIC